MHSQTSNCLADLIDSEAEINEKKQTETKSGI